MFFGSSEKMLLCDLKETKRNVSELYEYSHIVSFCLAHYGFYRVMLAAF